MSDTRRGTRIRSDGRAGHDAMPGSRPEIRRVWDTNVGVDGARTGWRQLTRDGIVVARGTGARLLRVLRLQGAGRGRTFKTTIAGRRGWRMS